jgi:hypothetical protein
MPGEAKRSTTGLAACIVEELLDCLLQGPLGDVGLDRSHESDSRNEEVPSPRERD